MHLGRIYVKNNPVNYIDPLGLDRFDIDYALYLNGKKSLEGPAPVVEMYVGGVIQGIDSFIGNYYAMGQANTIGEDAYFHCKVNCEAAQYSSGGIYTAICISDSREWFDQNIKGDPVEASIADQVANGFGRDQGSNNPLDNCQEFCEPFRPNGLSENF